MCLFKLIVQLQDKGNANMLAANVFLFYVGSVLFYINYVAKKCMLQSMIVDVNIYHPIKQCININLC